MRSRVDIWPAFADLFSAMLLGTFGALMLFEAGDGPGDGPVGPRPPLCVDVEAQTIQREVSRILERALAGQVRFSGDDVHIDVYLNFELNEDAILPADREKLGLACQALRDLFRDKPRWSEEVEIWIEGHTDGTVPRHAATPRDADLYNWRLSGNRAASVLYEFSLCGVTPATHRIRAIGYADTQPLPACAGRRECRENRRTTFRIRPDKAKIAERWRDFQGRTDCLPPQASGGG
jgi:outer membrane protein OmpA-like peptidoglycan-associated protein